MDNELDCIDGITPDAQLEEGEEREVKSQSSSSTYKVKRTFDHYYCTCPGGVPVNARTCKHLKSLLGDKYEAARIKLKNPDGPPPKGAKAKAAPKAKAKPASKTAAKPASKTATKRKRAADEDEHEDEDAEEDEEEDAKPASKRGRKAPAAKPKSKGKAAKIEEEDEEQDEDEDGGDEEVKSKSAPALLLASKWDLETGPDPTGWWVSEKLDGVRAFYDGKQFISRLGNPFTPPDWFIEKLPTDVELDGELYGGRSQFQSTVSIVKTVNSPHWKNISFQIFDIPSRGNEEFEARYDFLQKTFGENGTHAEEQIHVVKQELVTGKEHVFERLKEVEALGGEGLMLRQPKSKYEGYRSATLLKVKTFHDAEAVVMGHTAGKGRNSGVVGALKCKMASGKLFNVGSGLNHKIRANPPKVGTIITYRFQELTRDGVPRFPSFVGIAVDKTVPKDADVSPPKKEE